MVGPSLRAIARKDQAISDYRNAYADSDRLGAVAQGSKFRMLLREARACSPVSWSAVVC
jgi:hypothetical protein